MKVPANKKDDTVDKVNRPGIDIMTFFFVLNYIYRYTVCKSLPMARACAYLRHNSKTQLQEPRAFTNVAF